MAEWLDFEGLSSEAKIGKILVLIEIALSVLSFLLLSVFAPLMRFAARIPFMGILFGFAALLYVIKLALDVLSLNACKSNEFRNAGVYAIAAGLLPPDLLNLIAGVLFLASPEAKTGKKRRR